jgi:hypothetical protein
VPRLSQVISSERVLTLDGQQSSDDVRRALGGRSREQLRGETLGDHWAGA